MSGARNRALLQGLDDFDRTSLREGAAALALWPKNADRHAAFEALIDALASEQEGGGGSEIGAQGWADWLASEDARALQGVQADGYHDAPPAAEATVLGTRQGLLAGQLEFAALHYRLWMGALANGADSNLEAGRALLTAATSLCNRVVELGDIGSYKWSEHEPGALLAAPPEEEFERLRSALRIEFDDPEVASIFEPLLRGQEAPVWQPLSRETESLLLIANPWQLSLAALVRSVGLAARSPRFAAVLALLRPAALAVVAEAVSEMEWTIESVAEAHLVARADADCLVVIGVGVISPDPAQFAAKGLNCEAELVRWYEPLAARARSLGASHSILAVFGDGRAVIGDDPTLRGSLDSDPWIVGLGELQAMGEALRKDPLALPAVLRSATRPPWPANFDLLDLVGMVRQREGTSFEDRDRELDGTEYMLKLGRFMAARHPALAPDMRGWVEVTRWNGIEEPAIYSIPGQEEFALLVRGFGRCIWVTCPGTFEQRHDLVPAVAIVLAFWLARLLEAGFPPPPPTGDKAPLYIRFRLELDRRPGPQLVVVQEEMDTRIVIGPGFVEALCHGNNDSDRMLVGAALSLGKALVEGDVGPLLDIVAPEGRGTVLIWPRPEATSNRPRLDPPPPIEPRFRQEVERGLAASRASAGEVGIASEERFPPALESLARDLEAAVQGRIYSLEPASLRGLVALHELAIHQSTQEAILLPARHEVRVAETYPDLTDELFTRDLILRILIERASALPPRGSEPFGRRIGAALRAATELQLQLRGALDAARWEQAGGRVVVSPELGVRVELGGELPDASEAMRGQVTAAAPDLMADAHSDWWGKPPELGSPRALDEPIAFEGDWVEVDLAMAEEWGFHLGEMLRLLYALAAIADEQPDCVGCLAADAVAPELARRTAIPIATLGRAVERLTLAPCPDYDSFSEEHRPGRANRERSYLRRPLVALPSGELCWSSLHCKRAAAYLGSLVESGRLRASGALGKAVIRFSQALDRDFEDAVLGAVRDCGWRGEARLQQLGGVPLRRQRGEEIGDLDVLAWSLERREVWLLDAKRLNPGVEPGPMLREGLSFEKHAARHEERLVWVRGHLPELAREIGVESTEGWEIRAALVLDRPLTGAHLAQISMPIWTHWSLPQELSGEVGEGAAS